MKKALPILLLFLAFSMHAQSKKQIWATSFLDKKGPEFSAEKWLSDKPDMKGKFLIIDFWATWCGPCKRAIPEMNKFQEEFSENLVVIGLSNEPEAKVKSLKTPVMEYYSAIDTKGTTMRSYGVKGIPHCVLIDPDGIVRWEGWPQLKGHELTSAVIQEIMDNYSKE